MEGWKLYKTYVTGVVSPLHLTRKYSFTAIFGLTKWKEMLFYEKVSAFLRSRKTVDVLAFRFSVH